MADPTAGRPVVCDLAGRPTPALARREQVTLVGARPDADVVGVVPESWHDPRRVLRSTPRATTRLAAELAAGAEALVSAAPAAVVAAALSFSRTRVPGTPRPVLSARLPGGAWLADVSGGSDCGDALDLLRALVTLLDGRAAAVGLAGCGNGLAEVDARDLLQLPAGNLVIAPGPVARTVYELLVAPADRIGVLLGMPLPVVVGPVDDRSVELALELRSLGWADVVLGVAADTVASRRRAAGLDAGLASDPS